MFPVIYPGLIVHVPVLGNPLNETLPVGFVQVGCVIVPTTGLTGAVGTALITIFEVAVEIQPVPTLVTVKLYEVDGANPVIV